MANIIHPLLRANGGLAQILCLRALRVCLLGKYVQLPGTCTLPWAYVVVHLKHAWQSEATQAPSRIEESFQFPGGMKRPFCSSSLAIQFRNKTANWLKGHGRPSLALSAEDLPFVYFMYWKPLSVVVPVSPGSSISFGEDIQHGFLCIPRAEQPGVNLLTVLTLKCLYVFNLELSRKPSSFSY